MTNIEVIVMNGYCKYCYEDTKHEFLIESVPVNGKIITTEQLVCTNCDHGLAPPKERFC